MPGASLGERRPRLVSFACWGCTLAMRDYLFQVLGVHKLDCHLPGDASPEVLVETLRPATSVAGFADNARRPSMWSATNLSKLSKSSRMNPPDCSLTTDLGVVGAGFLPLVAICRLAGRCSQRADSVLPMLA